MSELTMSETEREAFLAALHVGVLAVERPEGPPLVTPVWYRYQPGGEVELTTESSSEKARLLQEVGHASLCVQHDQLPYAYVTVEGPVVFDTADREARVDIASRYLGAEFGIAYVDQGPVADNVMIRLQPTRWRTSDFAKFELPDA